MNTTCGVALSISLALSGPLSPAAPTPHCAAQRQARVSACRVSLIDEARVPARVPGLLVNVAAREGETVTAGQVVARIDDRQEAARLTILQLEDELAAGRSVGEAELQHAAATARHAEAEYADALATNQRVSGVVTSVALRRLEMERENARVAVQRLADSQASAELTRRIARARLTAAELSLASHQLVSPLAGVVVRRFRHPGEWVDAGDPVLHVVRMDRLRVEGLLNASEFPPHEIRNQPVAVRIAYAAGDAVELDSRITYVSPVVEAGGQYRICAEIQNRQDDAHWLLRPGMPAEMTVQLTVNPAP